MTNSEIRVILINDSFTPTIDGVVRVMQNYASNFIKKNVKVLVLAPKYKKMKLDEDKGLNYSVIRIPRQLAKIGGYEVMNTILSRKIWKEIENFKPNIVHSHTPFYAGDIANKIAKKFKIPSICSFHTLFYDSFLRFTKSKPIAKFLTHLMIKKLNKFDYIWPVSKVAQKALIEYGYKKESEIVQLGTNFFYPENADELKNKVIKKWNINTNNKNLLYVSRLVWEKNIKKVLLTYKKLVEENSNYHLTMVGGDINYKEIVKYAYKIGLKDKILFTGPIENQEELKGFYLSHDLFFYPSLYETYGLVVRESAALKLPLLVVENTACAENVIDGQNSFICQDNVDNMYEKIKQIFKDKNNLINVKNNMNNLFNSWEEAIEIVIEKYKKIIEHYKK